MSRRNFLKGTGAILIGAALAQTAGCGGSDRSSAGPYEGHLLRSGFLRLRDGTRLAYDLFLPARGGVAAREPLPVLFKYTPYLRRFLVFDASGRNILADLFDLDWKARAFLRIRYWLSRRGRYMDALDRNAWLKTLLAHGYAVIVVERPGTGASFGKSDPSFQAAAREADEILDWIAAQPWSNGKVGMYGDSWQGQIQLAAASTGNPHLKAILPAGTWLDAYRGVMFPGGIFNKAFGKFFNWSLTFLDSDIIVPVDEDTGGTLLAEARRARRGAVLKDQMTEGFIKRFPFADSTTSSGTGFWTSQALYSFTDRINRSGVAACVVGGWYDFVARDAFLIYANLDVPKRLLVRPLDHSAIDKPADDLDYGAEALRWFDRWLKGVDNGIMAEPPIRYATMRPGKPPRWRTAREWPPRGQRTMRMYFAQGSSGLSELAPTESASDAYTVDYTTTTGTRSRWTAVNWPMRYPDMAANDAKALSYTGAPLEADLVLTGHPVARLWLTTDTPDLDVFAYLESVGSGGRATYVTEGKLRASARALAESPFKSLGLPFHSHRRGDAMPIPPGEPVELTFDLLPTSYEFAAGTRLRVTIAFADADNFDTPALAPAPTLRLLRDPAHASHIDLPVEGKP
jgi:putative CocE/NonD family hydrolase